MLSLTPKKLEIGGQPFPQAKHAVANCSQAVGLMLPPGKHKRAIPLIVKLLWCLLEYCDWMRRGVVHLVAYSAVVAWSSVRRAVHRQRPVDLLPARDVEPSSAADHRGHRELV